MGPLAAAAAAAAAAAINTTAAHTQFVPLKEIIWSNPPQASKIWRSAAEIFRAYAAQRTKALSTSEKISEVICTINSIEKRRNVHLVRDIIKKKITRKS